MGGADQTFGPLGIAKQGTGFAGLHLLGTVILDHDVDGRLQGRECGVYSGREGFGGTPSLDEGSTGFNDFGWAFFGNERTLSLGCSGEG